MNNLVDALRKIVEITAETPSEVRPEPADSVWDIQDVALSAIEEIEPGIYVVDNDKNIIQVDGFSWGYEGLARPSTGQQVWVEDQGEYVVLMAGPGIEAATGRVVADLS